MQKIILWTFLIDRKWLLQSLHMKTSLGSNARYWIKVADFLKEKIQAQIFITTFVQVEQTIIQITLFWLVNDLLAT